MSKQKIIVGVDIFDVDIVLYYGYSPKEFFSIMKRKYNSLYKKLEEKEQLNISEDTLARTYDNGFVIIYMKERKNCVKKINTLSHEITHAVRFICDNRNIPLTDDTDEIYSYLQGYLMEQFYKKLK